jgi:uncharacterized protein YcbX
MAQDSSSSGAPIGRVHEIWRYPVSSMGGELLQSVAIERSGLAGDRKFGLYAKETGEVAAPGRHKHWRPLPAVLTRIGNDGVEISIDRKQWIGMREGERALSDYLGFAVAFRAYDGSAEASPLYKLSPIHLLTTSAMAELQEILPDAVIDARRFRANLVIDTDQMPSPLEQGWIGQTLSVGDVVLAGSEPCVRCAFTSLAQEPSIPFDKRVHSAISQRLDSHLGIYCTVTRPGRVQVGDAVRLAVTANSPSG